MSGPSVDLEKPNAVGGLDRLVTTFALSVIAVIPTFWACIVTPWRLRALVDRDEPDGRIGMLLAPGAFFPLSIMVTLIVAGLLATPETLSDNGAFIGPGLAVSVQSAASEGNVWKIIATVMPLYGIAILFGLSGMLLKPWTHQDWTLRVSLRAAFYVTGALIAWLILVTAFIDLVWLSTGKDEIKPFLYSIFSIPTLGWILWMYFWFFRDNGSVSWFRSAALSVGMIGLPVTTLVVADLIIRFF